MQKVNAVLLLVAIALLVGLWLRPQPGRYSPIGDDLLPYVLDTATGKLVVLEITAEVRADLRKQEEREKAERQAAHQEWLDENCPDILAGKKHPNPFVHSLLNAASKTDCAEWKRARTTNTDR